MVHHLPALCLHIFGLFSKSDGLSNRSMNEWTGGRTGKRMDRKRQCIFFIISYFGLGNVFYAQGAVKKLSNFCQERVELNMKVQSSYSVA